MKYLKWLAGKHGGISYEKLQINFSAINDFLQMFKTNRYCVSGSCFYFYWIRNNGHLWVFYVSFFIAFFSISY